MDNKNAEVAEYYEGYNPFTKDDQLNVINWSLGSILSNLGLLPGRTGTEYFLDGTLVVECNFDPVVTVDGKLKTFQRKLVWSLRQKQALINSIYSNIDCGKILMRVHGWEDLRKSKAPVLAFRDVIDGKQRLSAIKEFVNNEFPDTAGMYYKDFSEEACYRFRENRMLSYVELRAGSTDEQALRQFLKLNVSGTTQSPTHLSKVRNLYVKLLSPGD